jgi:uncharacterized delta-60 repeat protein
MRSARRLAAALTGFSVLLVAPFAHGSPGSLDPSFGGDGLVRTDVGRREGAESVAVQADGKIVVAGWSGSSRGVVARYKRSGALDPTFAGDGVRVVRGFVFGGVAVQADGNIVVAGGTPSSELAVARFNADGTPDVSFSGDGFATENTLGGSVAGLALQPNGGILVVGRTFSEHELGTGVIVRFSSNGTVDEDFGGPLFEIGSSAGAVAIQENSKIVVAGTERFPTDPPVFVLTRFRAGGRLDRSFGSNGAVRAAFGGDEVGVSDLALQADGRIVAVGFAHTASSGRKNDFALARYTRSGKLDRTFSHNGRKRTDFSGANDGAAGVAIQANGRIVVAGSAGPPGASFRDAVFGLARYRPNGKLDDTFSGNGKKRTRFGGNDRDYANDVALQANGRIVVAGSVTPRTAGRDLGLARYLAR